METITAEDRQHIIKTLRLLADMLDENTLEHNTLKKENDELKDKVESLKDRLRDAESEVEDVISTLNGIDFDTE